MKRVFPGARFVHVIRHPVPVVESLARRSQEGDRKYHPHGRFVRPPGWNEGSDTGPLKKFSRSWKKINTHLREQADEQTVRIHYEEFCDSPTEVVKSAHNRLGFDTTESLTRSHSAVENRNGAAYDRLSETEIDTIWGITGDIASEFGYGRDNWQ